MTRQVKAGLGALAKGLLVIVAVPVALWRLWVLSPLPSPVLVRSALGERSTWSHLILAVVALLWLAAAFRLLRELRIELRAPGSRSGASWSSRWAAELAGLIVLATSSTLLGAPTATHAPVAVSSRTTSVPMAARDAAPTQGPASPFAPTRLALEGLGTLLLLGLSRKVRLVRRLAECRRRPNERVAPDSPCAQAAALLLDQLGGDPIIEQIEAVNHHLWRAATSGAQIGDVILVRCGPSGVELLCSDGGPAPAPLCADRTGRWWCASPSVIAELPVGQGRQLPTLVPIGEDEDSSYLVALRPGRSLGILGEEPASHAVLAAMVLGLRVLPWGDELDVELLGLEPPPMSEHGLHLHASSTATLDDLTCAARRDRRAHPRPRWRREPLAVLAASNGHEVGLAARLRETTAVLVEGEPGSLSLVLDGEHARLEPLGLRVRPPRLAGGLLAVIDELLAPRALGGDTGMPPPRARPDRSVRGEIELTILRAPAGLVGTLSGSVTEEEADRVARLVGAVLERGGTAEMTELAEALHPGVGPSAVPLVANLAALARRLLGTDADGRSRLSPLTDGSLHLAASVTGDWLRARALLAEARAGEPEAAMRALEAALALVEARVQTHGSSGRHLGIDPADHDRLVADLVDGAHQLCGLALAKSELSLANWAVEKGRMLEPLSETLARYVLRRCEAIGDLAGARHELERLERGLAAVGLEPSPTTFELFEQLCGARGST